MDVLPKSSLFPALAIFALVAVPVTLSAQSATVQSIVVVRSPSGVEIQVTCTAPIAPQAQLVSDPDRLVIDFPQASPGAGLHKISLNRPEVKGIRVGLFSTRPPVTRVVLDLNGPQRYEMLPAGNRVLIKIGETAPPETSRLIPVSSVPPVAAITPAPPLPPKVVVRFQNGLLSITADRASLAEVLSEVQRRTGADIPIPAGADQEMMVANVGPLPAEAAMASLLNGSRFNFILVGSSANPTGLGSVILTAKSGLPAGQVISAVAPAAPAISRPGTVPPPQASDEDDSEDADEPAEAPPQDQAQPH